MASDGSENDEVNIEGSLENQMLSAFVEDNEYEEVFEILIHSDLPIVIE